MRAFFSYQNSNKVVAANVRDFFVGIGVECFMAHDDIEISQEWQDVILTQLANAHLFVAILSADYHKSPFCVQESGVAIFRGLTIIPLSIDGSIPKGFLARKQSAPIDPDNISRKVLFAGIAKHDRKFAIDCMIDQLRAANSFANAEQEFDTLFPYLEHATNKQISAFLDAAVDNFQVRAAWGIQATLREKLESHGHLLSEGAQSVLENALR